MHEYMLQDFKTNLVFNQGQSLTLIRKNKSTVVFDFSSDNICVTILIEPADKN